MAFEHMSFSIDDGSDMKLIVYTPLAAESTVAKLEALLGGGSAASHSVDRPELVDPFELSGDLGR